MISITQSWVPIERAWPKVFFLDGIDPRTFWEVISISNPRDTLLFFISSTGESPESVMPLMRCMEYWKSDIDALQHSLTIIAPKEKGSLHIIGKNFNLYHQEYPDSFLGCHQYFSEIMLSIAEYSGFHSENFKKGAALACTEFFRGILSVSIEYTALFLLAQKTYAITHRACHAHLFDFQPLAQWMNHSDNDPHPWIFQQHTQHKNALNVFYTLFMERNMTKEPVSPEFWQKNTLLMELSKNPLLSFVYKEHDTLCRNMISNGHFVRTLYVDKLDEGALGALFMNHMIENLLLKEVFSAKG